MPILNLNTPCLASGPAPIVRLFNDSDSFTSKSLWFLETTSVLYY